MINNFETKLKNKNNKINDTHNNKLNIINKPKIRSYKYVKNKNIVNNIKTIHISNLNSKTYNTNNILNLRSISPNKKSNNNYEKEISNLKNKLFVINHTLTSLIEINNDLNNNLLSIKNKNNELTDKILNIQKQRDNDLIKYY